MQIKVAVMIYFYFRIYVMSAVQTFQMVGSNELYIIINTDLQFVFIGSK